MKRRIILTWDEAKELMKPIRGRGGYQTLLRRLRDSVEDGTVEICVDYDDVVKIRRYRREYGGGGFQDRLAHALDRAWR